MNKMNGKVKSNEADNSAEFVVDASVQSSNYLPAKSMREILGEIKKHLFSAAFISGCINILMLSGSIFMLQVYDRVLPSHSIATLQALLIIIAIMYAFIVILETIRTQLFTRMGRHFDMRLRETIFDLNLYSSLPNSQANKSYSFKDLEQIRFFFASNGPSAFFDLPWLPIYSIILFVLHPYIGFLGIFGVIILTIITWQNDRATSPFQIYANNKAQEANILSETVRIGAETIIPLGMSQTMKSIWLEKNQEAGEAIVLSSDRSGTYGAISRFIRMSMQSFMLALGAYLTITGKTTGGVMIASTIILGRALAPVEQSIANWRSFINTRQSYNRLENALKEAPEDYNKTQLPPPSQNVIVSELSVGIPKSENHILNNLNFEMIKGDIVGLLGPSGSGKSTLLRSMVGMWPITKGSVRYDGSTLDQWDRDISGKFIGYLPQSVELFAGTIGQNISRFQKDADDSKIIKAASDAGIDKFVRGLENGFDSQVGVRGNLLSAGQRQRIALARALYDDPFILILDEPNSALDNDGLNALYKAIIDASKRGSIIIFSSHQTPIVQLTNKLLILANGTQQAFGPRDEIIKKYSKPNQNSNGLQS